MNMIANGHLLYLGRLCNQKPGIQFTYILGVIFTYILGVKYEFFTIKSSQDNYFPLKNTNCKLHYSTFLPILGL